MQRYFSQEKDGNCLILDFSEIHHIKNVMRYQKGDKIECIFEEKLYVCKIISPSQNLVEIIEELKDNNESDIDITIAIALVKEQKMDLILQKLTELGVTRIIPVAMERSVVKLDAAKFLKKKVRWQRIVKEAAEQSKRNKIPEITELYSIDDLKNINSYHKFICSTKCPENLINDYLQKSLDYATITFVIGPEGGISEKEECLLEENGFIRVSLGRRIMRVETAAIYVASIVDFCSKR